MKENKKITEDKKVKEELSSLFELTLRLEDELNFLVAYN